MKPCIGQRYIATYTHHNHKLGAMVELCARSEATVMMQEFAEFAKNISLHIAGCNPEDLDAMFNQPYALDRDMTVCEYVCEQRRKFKECVNIKRFVRWTDEDRFKWPEEEPPTPPKSPAVAMRLSVVK